MTPHGRMKAFAIVAILLAAIAAGLSAQESGLDELFGSLPPPSGGGEPAASPESPAAHEASAPGEASSQPAASVPGARSFLLSGRQTTAFHLPLFRDPMDYSGVYLAPRVENLFRLSVKLAAFHIESDWRADIWPMGLPTEAAGAAVQAGPALVTVTPGESYIETGTEALRFRAGYFVDAWGVADGVNPTNNVNPEDYARSLSPEAVPSLLFRVVYYPTSALSLEAVFEPYKRDDLFPLAPAASVPSALFTPQEISVTDPPFEPASAVYGFKASLYANLADLSISYLYDVDPYYTPQVSYASPIGKSLDLVRGRIHRIGADAKSSIGPLSLWLESCLSVTEDVAMTSYAIRNPFLSWTAGGDLTYGPQGDFYLSFQQTGRLVFGYDRSFYADYPGGMPNPLLFATDVSYATEYYERALSQSLGEENETLLLGFVLKSDFTFSDGRWKPGIAAAYYLPFLYDTAQETRYGSLYLEPSLSWRPGESFTITLGAELMFAWKSDSGSSSISLDTADRIGMWNDQSNLYLKLAMEW